MRRKLIILIVAIVAALAGLGCGEHPSLTDE